ncbi:MAG TPA: DUF4349 domain-containing protein [Streptosporangiaceae bacterium]|jgi:hypothetical protein|nr:DUF4349 domain-containing protein [Streptosporangiaceae bacterium]
MTRTFRAPGARARNLSLRTLIIAGAASVGAGLAVTACSASSQNGGGGAAAPLSAAGAPHRALATDGGTYSGTSSTGTLTKLQLPAKSIIYTAELSVRITKGTVTNAANKATTLVSGAGGYVSAQHEIAGRHHLRQVDLTLKIPVASYGPVLAQLRKLGERMSFNSHAVDVTQQVADVNSRVASAQAAIKQLRALLSKAGSVGELLNVQETINRQESSLEALLAQQRALAHETSYATVTTILVAHHERVVPKPAKTSPGFLAGLRGGWHALVTVVGWLVTVLGSVLPFLIPIAVIVAIALGGRRRLARKKAPPTAEPPAPAAS